jgi:GNAT superfamily N-acetyltransferase
MSDKKYTVDFQPNEDQIEQLKSWMIHENQQRTGLVHDLSIVTEYARKNTLATITLENEAIGFVTWDIFKRRGHIAVAAVAAKYHRSGVGRYLMEALFDQLLQKGILALYLECAPAISEKFWRKMGFKKMPTLDGYSNNDAPCLYKTLLAAQETGVSNIPYIQLYEYGSAKKIRFPQHYIADTNELLKQIIIPVSGDCCIEHVKSTIAERSEKVKNFRAGNHFDDPFLIITAL